MPDILDWWDSYKPLTKEEYDIVSRRMKHDDSPYETTNIWDNTPKFESDKKFKELTNEWFSLMHGSNCTTDTHYLTFNTSCSAFIRELFERHVDDDTLVITSDCEHPTVKECVSKCKNTLILSQYNDIRKFNFNKIKNEIKEYKKVFVYIIAVRNDTGEITPQSFFISLKNVLNNKEHIMILDDVQGMFLIPRDYSLFDYVLGTGHVIVNAYDVGIMISKKYYEGINAYNWGKDYLQPLKIVLNRKDKLDLFRYCCEQYFNKYIKSNPSNISQELCVPHIFTIFNDKFFADPAKSLSIETTHLLIAPSNTNIGFARIRALGLITNPNKFIKSKNILKYMLENNDFTFEDLENIYNGTTN